MSTESAHCSVEDSLAFIINRPLLRSCAVRRGGGAVGDWMSASWLAGADVGDPRSSLGNA